MLRIWRPPSTSPLSKKAGRNSSTVILIVDSITSGHCASCRRATQQPGSCSMRLREIALEQWERLKTQEGFTAPLCIAYGSVGQALRKAAHDLQADVVIIGRGHVKEPLGRL